MYQNLNWGYVFDPGIHFGKFILRKEHGGKTCSDGIKQESSHTIVCKSEELKIP